jgi:hypothetical protein
MDALLWFLMVADILILVRKNELNKVEDQSKLKWVESSFLIVNLITILIAFAGFLITFNQDWLAKEIRYFSLISGLPSVFAIIYWKVHINRRTTN